MAATELECTKRYIGTKSGELSLRVGNRIALERATDDGTLWIGKVINPHDGKPSGKSGSFPMSHARHVDGGAALIPQAPGAAAMNKLPSGPSLLSEKGALPASPRALALDPSKAGLESTVEAAIRVRSNPFSRVEATSAMSAKNSAFLQRAGKLTGGVHLGNGKVTAASPTRAKAAASSVAAHPSTPRTVGEGWVNRELQSEMDKSQALEELIVTMKVTEAENKAQVLHLKHLLKTEQDKDNMSAMKDLLANAHQVPQLLQGELQSVQEEAQGLFRDVLVLEKAITQDGRLDVEAISTKESLELKVTPLLQRARVRLQRVRKVALDATAGEVAARLEREI